MKLKAFCRASRALQSSSESDLHLTLPPHPRSAPCMLTLLPTCSCQTSVLSVSPRLCPCTTVLCVWTFSFFVQNSHASFKTWFVCLHLWEAFCCSELILSILYAGLHDETYLLNTAQPSGAPRQLCACEGSPGVHGEVWIRQYTLEPPTEGMYWATSPLSVFTSNVDGFAWPLWALCSGVGRQVKC